MKTTAPALWKHQKQTIAFGRKHARMLDLSDAGTGKTRGHIELFAERRRKRGGCALVICPKTLMQTAWGNDINKYAPDMRYVVCRAEKRADAFATDADIYITNTDATPWLVKQNKAFFKRFDTLVVDEATKFKHHTSQRSKALRKIVAHFEHRTMMSGTLNSNSITDVWHPALLTDDGERLGKSFFAFRSAVCTPQQVGPKTNMVDWVEKEGAVEAVFDRLGDIAIRHEFDQCMDIPKTHFYAVPYELSPKQLAAYREMEQTQLLWMEKQSVVTAINAASVRTKLLQIASGAVYESPAKYHVVDTGRYEMIMDLAEERKHPIVFFLWAHQKEQLIKEAISRKLRYCVFDGNASDKSRVEMERNYQAGFYDVMFAHPETVAHGLTLTRGTSIIWASPTDNLEWYAQGNRRQARGGQTHKTEVIVLVAPGTIDTRAYENLQGKGERMKNLLDLFAQAA